MESCYNGINMGNIFFIIIISKYSLSKLLRKSNNYMYQGKETEICANYTKYKKLIVNICVIIKAFSSHFLSPFIKYRWNDEIGWRIIFIYNTHILEKKCLISILV